MPQQHGHNLTADKAADRRPSEAHHDHRRPQALRRVVAGERRRPRKRAGDAAERVEARGKDGVRGCHAGQVQYLGQPEDKEVEIE